jgi:hypothetical protein
MRSISLFQISLEPITPDHALVYHTDARRQQTFVGGEAAHRARIRILAGTAFRAHQIERVPLGYVASPACHAIAGLERAEIDRVRAEDDVVHVHVGDMASRRALVDDRDRTVTLGGDRGSGRRVLHALEGLGDHDGVPVDRAAPERPAADALFGRVLDRAAF